MAEQTYVELGPAYQDDHDAEVPLTGSSGPSTSPTTSAFSQLSYTPTGQVAPYMYSSTPDTHLLTPSSLAASPLVPQAAEFVHDYNSPTTTSMPHQPTLSATSALYSGWTSPALGVRAPQDGPYSPVDPNHSSTPGPSFPSVDCIVPDDDWVNTSYTSRSPSFGHFGVSEASWLEQDGQPAPYGGSNSLAYMMERQAHGQVQQHPETTMNTPLPQFGPTFSAGDSNAFQQPNATLNARPSGPVHGASHLHDVYNRSRSSGRVKSRIIKDTRRRIRPNAKKSGEQSTPQRVPDEPFPYEFKEGTSEENRFVVEAYELCKGAKGGTMWTDVMNLFEKKFGRRPSKSNLQMMRGRALKQCVVLSPVDEELMLEVFIDYEHDRYSAMIRIFHERGGSPSINPAMLEHYLVSKGYERFDMDPKTKVRPRMKVTRGGRSTTKRAVQTIQRRAIPPPLTESEQEMLCIQIESRESSDDRCSRSGMMKDKGDVETKEEDRRGPNTFQQLGGLKREYDDI